MADIPIIFSAPMVKALLAGQKTMTRRLAWRSEIDTKRMSFVCDGEKPPASSKLAKNVGVQMAGAYWLRPTPWQRVKPGDRLWVRENLCQRQGEFMGTKQNVIEARYAADEEEVLNPDGFNLLPWWKGDGGLPSIHMPRYASRITILVDATKMEPVQAISDADAKAEGIVEDDGSEPDIWYVPGAAKEDWKIQMADRPSKVFGSLWKALHGAESWDANPEVVAMSGKVIIANIDSKEVTANGG